MEIVEPVSMADAFLTYGSPSALNDALGLNLQNASGAQGDRSGFPSQSSRAETFFAVWYLLLRLISLGTDLQNASGAQGEGSS